MALKKVLSTLHLNREDRSEIWRMIELADNPMAKRSHDGWTFDAFRLAIDDGRLVDMARDGSFNHLKPADAADAKPAGMKL